MTDSDMSVEVAKIYLGLGSNLGDRMGNLASAVEHLSKKVTVEDVSSVYETYPVGYMEQPLFINAVLSATTRLAPFELLCFVKAIERGLGREANFCNAPRPIDIDILLYGEHVIKTPELTIPHPGVAERAFVLVPLVELSPRLIHPLIRKKFSDLLAEAGGLDGVRWVGRLSLTGRLTS